jgi:hypothetical protein
MIKVEKFTGPNAVRALAPAWRQLTAQLTLKRHFHHVEWHQALAETFERHNMPPLECLAVFSSSTLVAVFPFRVVPLQIGPIRLNAMKLASDQIDADTARDFVLAGGLPATNFFQGFVKYLTDHDPTWDVIMLPGILEDSLAASAIKHSPQLPIVQTPGGAWGRIEMISCAEDNRPFDNLSKGFKQNLRTAHNKLKSTSINFQCARTNNELEEFLPDFLRIESSGWKGEMGTSASQQPHSITFLNQLIANFADAGQCEIYLLRANGESIAALFGIVTDRILYIFRIGYDERHHRVSPGHLIIENLMKETSAQRRFDIITPYNAPPWFRSWKPDQVLQIFNAFVFRPTAEGIETAKRLAMVLRTSSY